MKLKFILLLSALSFVSMKAQVTLSYFDPVLTSTMGWRANELNNKQERTIEEQKKLNKLQTTIAGLTTQANRIQGYIQKGLKTTSSVLREGLTAKACFNEVVKIKQTIKELNKELDNVPPYASSILAFKDKQAQKLWEEMVAVGSYLYDITENKSGKFLATSGERQIILDNMEEKLRNIRYRLIGYKYTLRRFKRVGLWNMLSPFSFSWSNDSDTRIFDDAVNDFRLKQTNWIF